MANEVNWMNTGTAPAETWVKLDKEVEMPITQFKAFLNADMAAVVQGVWTKLTWDGIVEDSRGWFDTTNRRYTVQEYGLYLFVANLEFANITDQATCDIAFWRNGGGGTNNKVHTQFMSSKTGEFVTAHICFPFIMNAGDYVEVYGKHSDTGGNRTISTSHEETWFTGFKVGAG